MENVKSLRDWVLEFTVVNFDKMFFENGGAKQVKKHICLPPMLFEDIQNKSKEICWIIPHKSLTACLSNRDALNWVKIELRVGLLTLDDMLQIEKSDFPIKRLSFETTRLTNAMLDVIEKFSSTIEVLEIDYQYSFPYISDKWCGQCSSLLKFPKLRFLSIDLSIVPIQLFQRFDFSSCSDSLKKLCLFGHLNFRKKKKVDKQSIMTFFDSLKVLKNLESLTIHVVDICVNINSIVDLKNLRTLDLSLMPSNIPPGQSLVNILPKLENLTLPEDNLRDELISLNGKKLNYAGLFGRFYIPEHLKQVNNDLGLCPEAISYVMSNGRFPHLTEDKSTLFCGGDMRKVEKRILAHMMWGLFDVEYCAVPIIKYKDYWSHEFIIKLTNLVTSLQICEDERFNKKLRRFEGHFQKLLKHQPLIDYKKSYVALNPNSSISKIYKKIPPVV